MPKRLLQRSAAALAAPIVVAAIVFAGAGVASAHDVTGITATCDTVRVEFAGFPSDGVMVHIAATTEGHGTLSKDVLVDATTTHAELNIASMTSTLAGATANVDVDVTWTFEGPQHVHKTFSVTCGTTTTTTGPTTTTTAARLGSEGATSTTAAAVSGASETAPSQNAAAETAATSATAAQTLPRTGTSTLPLIITALVALATGTGLVITQRRRITGN